MPGLRRTARVGSVLSLGVLVLSACGSALPGRAVPAAVPEADRALIRAYVEAFNRAGDAGPEAQAAFLRDTQETRTPLPPPRCFGAVSLRNRIVERTLRPAPTWTPPSAAPAPPTSPITPTPPPSGARPAGAVYVVAAAVVASRDGTTLREDVGSKHFVVRDGRVYGYAPCPS